jgi:putative aldouronate transport system substrate-binding protein
MVKKILKVIFLIVSASLIVACSNKTNEEVPVDKQIVLSFFTSDASELMLWNDPVAQEITIKTGVSLDIKHPVANDTQAVSLMIASGEFPDLIYAKGELSKLVEAGAVIPLDDLIEKYGKNIKDLYEDQIVRLRYSSTDPNIYSVGTYGVKQAILETSGVLQIQHAVLKELGYPVIKTLEDYQNAIRAYKKKYPTIDGQETIGFSLLIDSWQWYIGLSNPGGFTIGYPDDGQWIVDENLTARYKFLDPEIYKFYKWLNEMNEEGLLDKESFTQKEDVWKSKVAAGRVLGIAYPSWGYTEARATLVQSGQERRTYAYLPITVSSEYKDPSLKDYGFSGGWGIAISSSCKDPERAFRFLDWMCSEEAQILLNWGIEGVNYIVENGKRVVPSDEQRRAETDPDYAKKTGVGRWIYPFPQRGTAALDSNGDYISRTSRQRIIDNYLPVEKETLEAYGADMWIDLFPTSEELGVSKHGQVWQYALPPELNEKVTAADEYVKTALTRCVLSEPGDFDKQWNQMQSVLKEMGMQQAGLELTAIISDKMKLWEMK